MDIKKILPFVIVAVLFLVGGYFIGKAGVMDQGAALYNATTMPAGLGIKSTGTETTGPTGGDVPGLASSGTPTAVEISMRKCMRLGGDIVIDQLFSNFRWHCDIAGNRFTPTQTDSYYNAILGAKESITAESIQQIRGEVVKRASLQTTTEVKAQ